MIIIFQICFQIFAHCLRPLVLAAVTILSGIMISKQITATNLIMEDVKETEIDLIQGNPF